MKFSALILSLVLFLLFNASDSNAQVKSAELEKLEAQLKQLDEADSVEIEIDGDSETSGTITITVTRDVSVTTTDKNKTIIGTTKTKKKKVTLPTIDLSKITVSDEYIDEKMRAAASSETMCGELPGVVMSPIQGTKKWMVMTEYVYDSGTYKITIPKEPPFIYDRASIPRIFWVLGIDQGWVGEVAPLIHDLLYQNGGVLPAKQVTPYRKFSRKEADKLFLEIMEKCNVSPGRRELAYKAVKKFGKSSWKKK